MFDRKVINPSNLPTKGLRDDILILTFQLTARPLSSIAHILAEGRVVQKERVCMVEGVVGKNAIKRI